MSKKEMAKKESLLEQTYLTRRGFMKKTGVIGASIMGASLFDPVGTPFLFAQTKEPIKFGFPEILTGTFAAQGIAQINGAKLAEKHINAAGGIMGRPLKLIIEDTGGKTETAARVAKRMILQEGVIAINGDTTTGSSVAISKVCKENEIIHFKCESDGMSVVQAMHKLAFHIGDNGPVLVRGLGWVALHKFPNVRKWATLVPDYTWGYDCQKSLEEYLAKMAPKQMEIKSFVHPFGCADFSSYILQINEYKPDVLVSFAWSGDFVTFLRQQKPYKLYQKVIGMLYANPITPSKAMANDMEPMWSCLYGGHPSIPKGMKFNEMYLKEYGEWVQEDTVASYYDSVFILKKAIEMAKSAKPVDVAKKLEGLEYDGYSGWVKINPVSHLPIKKTLYAGYLGPIPNWPYWGAKEIVNIPYEDVMITDQEVKEIWKVQLPYTS
jgi:branched-chain amino acid transport system substrate-binding protein